MDLAKTPAYGCMGAIWIRAKGSTPWALATWGSMTSINGTEDSNQARSEEQPATRTAIHAASSR
ncbi:hypothetical protein N9293_00590 [Planctomycetota bacterium]|nr:hypothetical protein [bacterium]MDB4559377.1 hypothetical protein [Planctomycetota bacterium]